MKVEFRPMAPADSEQVLALDHQAFSKKVRFTNIQFRVLLDDPEVSVFVASAEDGKALASCIVKIRSLKKEMRLISLVVDESLRRQGIGRMMMQNVLALARHLQLYSILLQVNSDNASGIQFFKNFEFSETKKLPDFLFPGNEGTEMKLALAEQGGIKVFSSQPTN